MRGEQKVNLTRAACELILLFLVVILVCVAFLFFSTAWFAKSTTVADDGIDISIPEDNSIAISSVTVYKYLADEDRMIKSDDYPNNLELLHLNPYDTVFEDRRENTPIIVKVVLDYKENEGFSVGLKCSGEFLSPEQEIQQNLSNIMNVRCAVNSDLDRLTEDSQITDMDFYTAAKTFFRSNAAVSPGQPITDMHYESLNFVQYSMIDEDIQVTGKEKTLSHTVSTGNYNPDTKQIALFLFLDYNPELVNYYLESSDTLGLDAALFESGNILQFENDILSLEFQEI